MGEDRISGRRRNELSLPSDDQQQPFPRPLPLPLSHRHATETSESLQEAHERLQHHLWLSSTFPDPSFVSPSAHRDALTFQASLLIIRLHLWYAQSTRRSVKSSPSLRWTSRSSSRPSFRGNASRVRSISILPAFVHASSRLTTDSLTLMVLVLRSDHPMLHPRALQPRPGRPIRCRPRQTLREEEVQPSRTDTGCGMSDKRRR
jgi:hypothetical protein